MDWKDNSNWATGLWQTEIVPGGKTVIDNGILQANGQKGWGKLRELFY